MTDLIINEADVAPVIVYEQFTVPLGEAIPIGDVARIDTTTGKATKSNATASV